MFLIYKLKKNYFVSSLIEYCIRFVLYSYRGRKGIATHTTHRNVTLTPTSTPLVLVSQCQVTASPFLLFQIELLLWSAWKVSRICFSPMICYQIKVNGYSLEQCTFYSTTLSSWENQFLCSMTIIRVGATVRIHWDCKRRFTEGTQCKSTCLIPVGSLYHYSLIIADNFNTASAENSLSFFIIILFY